MNAFTLAMLGWKVPAGGGGGGPLPTTMLAFNETGSTRDVYIYDSSTMLRTYTLAGSTRAYATPFSKDQQYIAVSRVGDAATKVYDTSTGLELSALASPASSASSKESYFGELFLYATFDVAPYVYRYSLIDWSVEPNYSTALPSEPTRVRESPDGQVVAYMNQSGNVELYNISDNSHIQQLNCGGSTGYDLAWSPDSQYLIATNNQIGARIFQRSDWTQFGPDITPEYTGSASYPINAVAFSSDGTLVVFGNNFGNRIHRYSWPAMTHLGALPTAITVQPYDLDFNSDNSLLSIALFSTSQKYRVLRVSDWADVSALSPSLNGASAVTRFN